MSSRFKCRNFCHSSCKAGHKVGSFLAIDMDNKEHIEKFMKYEDDFTQYLKAKYFSNKDIYGDAIFNEKAVVDGMVIKASRIPGTESYADPVKFLEERSSRSKSGAETPTNSNGWSIELASAMDP